MGFLQWSLRASEGTAVDLMVNISKKNTNKQKKALKKKRKKKTWGWETAATNFIIAVS